MNKRQGGGLRTTVALALLLISLFMNLKCEQNFEFNDWIPRDLLLLSVHRKLDAYIDGDFHSFLLK